MLTIYILVAIGLKKAFGPEAAGAGAIALTTLATSLLPKYRQRDNDHAGSSKGSRQRVSWYLILLLVCGFAGTQMFIALSYENLCQRFPFLPHITNLTAGLPVAVGLQIMSYGATGALIAFALRDVSLETIAMSAIIAYACSIVAGLEPDLVTRNWYELRFVARDSAPLQVFCIVYVFSAIAPRLLRAFLKRSNSKQGITKRHGVL